VICIAGVPSLPDVLRAVGLVDHHAHGILFGHPASLDEFRGLFSESLDPRQWPHVATAVSYRRAMQELAGFLGCDPDEQAVYERRLQAEPGQYAAALRHSTRTAALFVDGG